MNDACTIIAYINGMCDWKLALFYMSIASMQLLEYFIWTRGLGKNNTGANAILSKIGLLLIFVQPICTGLLIKNRLHQIIFYILYALWIVVFFYMSSPIIFKTSIAKNGHLNWEHGHCLYVPRSGFIIQTNGTLSSQ